MKVSVIGPGALGCLFATRLADCGIETTLVDYRRDRAKRLAKSGLTVETDGADLGATPEVALRVPPGQDLVLVLTKTHATDGLELPKDVPILTLQNGLGNVEKLCGLASSSHVLSGATSEASTHVAEGRVRHAASGLTQFGAWTSCPVDSAHAALSRAGFRVEITDSPGQVIWQKAAISGAVNTLTALLDVPNGRLLEISEARGLMRDLVAEAAKVASTEGYRFDESLIEAAERVCSETATNISSMLQDVRAGRQTEIESISGEILRRADLAMIRTPRTRVIYQLVKGLEQR